MSAAQRSGRVLTAVVALCVLLAGCSMPTSEVSTVLESQNLEQSEVENHVMVDVSEIMLQVPVRRYEPTPTAAVEPWATLVWARGGSFVRGTLDWPEGDWVSRRLAEAGLRVYSVDYTLASDTVKAPVPAHDVGAVLRWAAQEHPGPLVVGGASAGAHLAALAALDAERPADALILAYPTLHRVQREDPDLSQATAALPEQRQFGPTRIADMYEYYLGGSGAEVVGELPAERLAQLPPTVIINADIDDLRASGEQFAEQLHEAGVEVVVARQEGTVHGYLNRPDESGAAGSYANATIERFVAELRRIIEVPLT